MDGKGETTNVVLCTARRQFSPIPVMMILSFGDLPRRMSMAWHGYNHAGKLRTAAGLLVSDY